MSLFGFNPFGFGSREPAEPQTLESRTLEAVADHIKSGKVKRITVMTGAGISTAAGIPDFRSPGTGLYSNLERLKLPEPEAVFDISFFRDRPEPFYVLAKELYPGKFQPTISHAFIALLSKKGLLQMNFTQNIDCLERQAGVPPEKVIEAHGSFATQSCIECKEAFPDDEMLLHVEKEIVPRCASCNGLVKPNIVFFGEPLPRTFSEKCHLVADSDLAIIIGTSLTVYPFAGLPELVPRGSPRLLLNKVRVGQIGNRSDDVVELGSCDAGVRKLADLLGWRDELENLWRSVVGDSEAERQIAAKDDEQGGYSDDSSDSEPDEDMRKLAEVVNRINLGLESSAGDDASSKPGDGGIPTATGQSPGETASSNNLKSDDPSTEDRDKFEQPSSTQVESTESQQKQATGDSNRAEEVVPIHDSADEANTKKATADTSQQAQYHDSALAAPIQGTGAGTVEGLERGS
ncbi:uncharacterized protein PgNI_12399 [Pyricularia grisea]|uniref:Deacetylase sirtuin-type domain-containing protein n=1 Tax=Pyricularia grisea TaxID=148305 RepID=A0A6P8AMC3_PYRGI|nr:uncharacterized protein PgNI_12399 [Pyricularia grisea]TLD03169.1 hypothetical protein PgNI_12399 [Pyricularia grisea]